MVFFCRREKWRLGERERGREVVRCEVVVAGLIEMAGVAELQRTERVARTIQRLRCSAETASPG
jgi:hypothetical protein